MQTSDARRTAIAGLSAIEQGPADAPVDLVFLHANGFHAALYTALLAPLATDRRVLALDLRGHGRTNLPADPLRLRDYRVFIRDLLRVLDELGSAASERIVLAGHSLGANVALLTAAERPEHVRALSLIEPVVAPSAFHLAMRTPPVRAYARRKAPIARGAARRRPRFDSYDAAFAAYKGRGAFRTWPDETLRAYVEEGFVEDEGGGVKLRCDPAWESAIYVAMGDDVWGALRRTGEAGVGLIVRAGARGSTFHASSERRLRRLRPDADIERIEQATHFLPQEHPEIAQDAIRRALAAPMR